MIQILLPHEGMAAPFVAMATAAAEQVVVAVVEPDELIDCMRRLAAADPMAVIVVHAGFVAATGMPEWLREVPALAVTRLLVDRALPDSAAARAWAAATDAVVALPGAAPRAFLTEFVVHEVAAGDVAAFVRACAAAPAAPDQRIECRAESMLPTTAGRFRLRVYDVDGVEHAVLVSMGELAGGPLFVRVHSECFTGEVLGSLKCDCDAQLRMALDAIAARGRGALVYLRQEGRGIGLANKIRAYAEQERGADTVQANHILGFPTDLRDFAAAARILREQGVTEVLLETNNPRKVQALRVGGIAVREVRRSIAAPNEHNYGYLRAKLDALGHLGLADALAETLRHGRPRLDPTQSLLIFDLDGVLQFGRAVHAEAAAMVHALRQAGFTLRFLTNDGCNSRRSRLAQLHAAGLEVELHELYTSSYLAARYVADRGPVLLLGGQPADEEFAHLPRAGADARTVVVGDWFGHYDHAALQTAFEAVERGAELVAVHRKRRWTNVDRRLIDVGFWVAGLEYCTGRKATIVGKPAGFAYRAVLEDAGFGVEQTLMISDESDPDLSGAAALGMHTVLFGELPKVGPSHASFGVAASYAALRALLRVG